MLAFARFMIMGFVVLTVVYGSLWFYLRARRRDLLEQEWAASSGEEREQERYVDEELALYDRRRHRSLVLFVYLLPLCLVALIVYRTNFE